MAKKKIQTPGAIPVIFTRVAPFLLPAIFFQSALFALISPLPFFILTLSNDLWISALALFTNAAFLYSMGNRSEIGIAVYLWTLVGVVFPFFIKKLGKVQKSFLLSFSFFVASTLAILFYLSHQANLDLITYVKTQISLGIDHIGAIPDSPIKKLIEEEGRETLLKQLMTEFPSGLLITMLVVYWFNLLLASRVIGGFLSKTFWASYRNPEWLVWPTMVAGALFAFSDHALYFIGLNGFKVLVVFYGFQGLSILSFFLNRYKILGLGRVLLFGISIFLALPVILSLGFFDLWFDFRKKFGQFK